MRVPVAAEREDLYLAQISLLPKYILDIWTWESEADSGGGGCVDNFPGVLQLPMLPSADCYVTPLTTLPTPSHPICPQGLIMGTWTGLSLLRD